MTEEPARSGRRPGEGGFSMVALLAMLAIMALALLLALPSWRYLIKDDKEQELIFRGGQISSAIARFQRKNANALPASLDQLVQGKFLRKAYKDPMTSEGKWRIIRPGQAGPLPPGAGPQNTTPGRAAQSPTPTPSSAFGPGSGTPTGPMAGVASTSTEDGLRLVNGTKTYSRWVFAPNIPLIVGGQPAAGGPPGGAANQAPAQGTLRDPDVASPRISR